MKNVRYATRYVALLAALAVSGCSDQPQSYGDCLLKNIKVGQTEKAVALIHRGCDELYSRKKTANGKTLPADALANVTGRLAVEKGSAKGLIYNANPDWKVTYVVVEIASAGVEVATASNPNPAAPQAPEQYGIDTTVLPLSTERFEISVNWRDEFITWKIVSAKGEQISQ